MPIQSFNTLSTGTSFTFNGSTLISPSDPSAAPILGINGYLIATSSSSSSTNNGPNVSASKYSVGYTFDYPGKGGGAIAAGKNYNIQTVPNIAKLVTRYAQHADAFRMTFELYNLTNTGSPAYFTSINFGPPALSAANLYTATNNINIGYINGSGTSITGVAVNGSTSPPKWLTNDFYAVTSGMTLSYYANNQWYSYGISSVNSDTSITLSSPLINPSSSSSSSYTLANTGYYISIGTISATLGSTTINGSGTKFLTGPYTVSPGMFVNVANTSQKYIISSVNSDTSITIQGVIGLGITAGTPYTISMGIVGYAGQAAGGGLTKPPLVTGYTGSGLGLTIVNESFSTNRIINFQTLQNGDQNDQKLNYVAFQSDNTGTGGGYKGILGPGESMKFTVAFFTLPSYTVNPTTNTNVYNSINRWANLKLTYGNWKLLDLRPIAAYFPAEQLCSTTNPQGWATIKNPSTISAGYSGAPVYTVPAPYGGVTDYSTNSGKLAWQQQQLAHTYAARDAYVHSKAQGVILWNAEGQGPQTYIDVTANGTIAGTQGSYTITGAGTTFINGTGTGVNISGGYSSTNLSSLLPGMGIQETQHNQSFVVKSVESDTSFTVTTPIGTAFTGAGFVAGANLLYTGDPRLISQFAPEMDGTIPAVTSLSPANNTATLIDQIVGIYQAANLKVGFCLRPHVNIRDLRTGYYTPYYYNDTGRIFNSGNTSGYIETDGLIEAELVNKINYCINRWNARLFYVDSIDVTAPEIFWRLAKRYPNVIFLPEQYSKGLLMSTLPYTRTDENYHPIEHTYALYASDPDVQTLLPQYAKSMGIDVQTAYDTSTTGGISGILNAVNTYNTVLVFHGILQENLIQNYSRTS
jgi:hypothetical protein